MFAHHARYFAGKVLDLEDSGPVLCSAKPAVFISCIYILSKLLEGKNGQLKVETSGEEDRL